MGRYTAKPIYHPVTKEKIADRNVYISDELGKIIVDAGIEGVDIRTIYSCDARRVYVKNVTVKT